MKLKRSRFLIFVFSLCSLASHICPTFYGIENRCQMPKILPFFLLYSQIFASIFEMLTKYYYYTIKYTLTFLTLLSILSHFSHLPIFHFLYSLSILSPSPFSIFLFHFPFSFSIFLYHFPFLFSFSFRFSFSPFSFSIFHFHSSRNSLHFHDLPHFILH